MIDNHDTMERKVEEYCNLLGKRARIPEGDLDWASVERVLHSEGEWTREGAAHVAALAKDYGAFVLRNALALAVVLGIEDGELGL